MLARGKLTKTKLKEQARLKKAEWKLAQKKPIELSIREHIGKFIDNVKTDDVAFLVAWVGVALILRGSLDFMTKLKKAMLLVVPAWLEIAKSLILRREPRILELVKAEIEEDKGVSIQEWIIIFAVSYIIVKHFGAIMQTVGSIGQGLIKLGTLLLG